MRLQSVYWISISLPGPDWRCSATMPKSGVENDIRQSDSGWEISEQGEAKSP
jgi:hypothetical protein